MGTTDPAIDAEFDRDSVRAPAWRSNRATRGPLSRDAIIDAALRVLDREGVDRLSMRQVGEELGTGQATIYWHVRNKSELLRLVAERAVAEVRLPEPDPGRWAEQLSELAMQVRAAMKSHRDLARISLGRIPAGPTTDRIDEWLFRLLSPVGIPGKTISYAGDLFGLYVGAYAFEESLSSAPGHAAEFPLVPHRPPDGDVDARFEFGVATLVNGLKAYANDAR
jgi:AcrR family transcriptional regulator